MDYHKKEKIKASIAGSIVSLIIIIAIIIMIKYQVEGEKNMPFTLSKITVISTAEGVEKVANTEEKNKWNLSVYQNNDVYFSIQKNENNKKEDAIQSIDVQNITIQKAPEKGIIQTYMPNSVEGRIFSYDTKYLIEEQLEYKGAAKSDTKTLEIGNQGGNIAIRFSNANIGTYISNEDEEIKHDGTLLNKVETTAKQIEFSVNFDFIMTIQNQKYKANITLDMPCGNIIEQGTCTLEKTDMQDVIFKRF